MLAKVHLAAKELGLDEESRRDILERLTGQRSAAGLNDRQLDQVLNEFKRLGWKPKTSGAGPKAADSPMARKARAMWLSLWNLGVVRNGTEKALEAFGARQLGVDRLQWADQSQGFRLIEALKAMAERAGWSQDVAGLKPDRQAWSLKARLVQAQARLLGDPMVMMHALGERDLDRMATELGKRIRAKASEGEDGVR
jgi:phage gp16-like protein